MSIQKQKRLISKVSCLICGLIILAMVFSTAITMSRRPPVFDVQVFALQENINTSAFFYTDID